MKSMALRRQTIQKEIRDVIRATHAAEEQEDIQAMQQH